MIFNIFLKRFIRHARLRKPDLFSPPLFQGCIWFNMIEVRPVSLPGQFNEASGIAFTHLSLAFGVEMYHVSFFFKI